MKNMWTNITQTNIQPNQLTNPSILIDNTLSKAPDLYTLSSNESQSNQIFLKTKPKKLYQTKKIKGKNRNFTLNEDSKILNLVLQLGPKFKQIAKKIPGKSIKSIKNRYYKYLRYRWDQILGIQYTHLNEKLEETSLENIVANSCLHQDLANILIPVFSQIQMVIEECLN
ncbi:unnamed protein product [Paramecium sonneborni]|uniref:HTH myb-type domain-containing protein n=1 Tax=Paramecium sonneborni TaxID=65129 RepID=A0A8S1RBP3_9CILI|nr:unnamed protein product [Paramecium sonneborni]